MAVAASTELAHLEQYIEDQLAAFHVPGVSLAVIKGDDILLLKGFGKRRLEGDLPMTENTVMPIGSTTKTFTSALLATLVDDGLIEWDKPVRDYLPDFRMYDPVATDNMTPRDLLCHRSGLPRHDMVWYGNKELTRADAVHRLRYLKPNKGFREVWQYNNLMFLTAGYLAETLLGMSWEDAVRTRLLEPLGMSNTTFSVDEAQALPDHARPYVFKDEKNEEVPYRGIDLAGPAGSINAPLKDLARWAVVHANKGSFEGKQIVSAAAVKQMHGAAMVMPEGGDYWPENTGIAYGLGWFINIYRGHRVLHHGGNIDGFSSMLTVIPEAGIAVVALTNLHGTPLRDFLPLRIFDELLGLEPLPWEARYLELFEGIRSGMKTAKEHRAATTQDAPTSHPLEAYAGRYTHPGYGVVTIRHQDGILVPEYNDNRIRMKHLQYDTFELEVEPFDEGQGMRVRFETDFDGEVSVLRVPFEPSVDPIEMRREPDDSLKDESTLQRYAGEYSIGPVVATVTVDDHELYIEVAGQPRQKLIPKRARLFGSEASEATVEFVEVEGKITSVVAGGVSLTRVE